MKRTPLILGILAASFAGGAFSHWMLATPTAVASMPDVLARKAYTPRFCEWVNVWLRANIERCFTDDGFITAAPEYPNHSVRWIVRCRYRANTAGGRLIKKECDVKLSRLRGHVADWRERGYQIKMSDFVLDCKPF